MDDKDRAGIHQLAESLTAAWNAADGAGFGAHFSDDADFVTVEALHKVGREAIAKGHQRLFETIYRDSRIAFTLSNVRELADGLAVAIMTVHLQVPSGRMAGEQNTIVTAVAKRAPVGWHIISFQNTIEQPLRPRSA